MQEPAPKPRPKVRPLWTRIAAVLLAIATAPVALVLLVFAFAAPFSVWGWLVTVAIVAMCGGAITAPGRRWRRFGPTRAGFGLLAFVLGAHAVTAGRYGSVRAAVIPEGGGPGLLASLLEERDIATSGAAALVALDAFPRHERGRLLPLTRAAYAELAESNTALPAPIVPTLLGMESAERDDVLLVGPEDAAHVVVFLHGSAGNFSYECATVARAAAQAGYATVCPSAHFDGRWWLPDEEPIVRVAIDYAKRRHHVSRVVLAGLSNGAISASRLAPRYARDLAGLVLISGAAPGARGAGVPTLVVQGDVDGMCSPDAAREYARRTGARLAMLHGSHFLLLEDEPGSRAAIVAFLERLR